jgi:hypothetical protein
MEIFIFIENASLYLPTIVQENPTIVENRVCFYKNCESSLTTQKRTIPQNVM